MGTGNDMDDNVRARGANASIVGEPFDTNETKDLFLENQELKVIINYLGQQKMKTSIIFLYYKPRSNYKTIYYFRRKFKN